MGTAACSSAVAGSTAPPRDDRIFVINIWGDPVDSTHYRNALAINGRSFPYSERIEATVGDTVHWRWIVNGRERGARAADPSPLPTIRLTLLSKFQRRASRDLIETDSA